MVKALLAGFLLSLTLFASWTNAFADSPSLDGPGISSGLNAVDSKQIIETLNSVRQTHIRANTPPGYRFKKFLQRDLDAHFAATQKQKVKVEFELLQKEALQLGVGYPFYYLWIKVIDPESGAVIEQGMLGAKAIDKTMFGIGPLVPSDLLCAKTVRFPDFFPASLCAAAIARAEAARPEAGAAKIPATDPSKDSEKDPEKCKE